MGRMEGGGTSSLSYEAQLFRHTILKIKLSPEAQETICGAVLSMPLTSLASYLHRSRPASHSRPLSSQLPYPTDSSQVC
jgi:hypothetical protein